jgi:hypothetical protein
MHQSAPIASGQELLAAATAADAVTPETEYYAQSKATRRSARATTTGVAHNDKSIQSRPTTDSVSPHDAVQTADAASDWEAVIPPRLPITASAEQESVVLHRHMVRLATRTNTNPTVHINATATTHSATANATVASTTPTTAGQEAHLSREAAHTVSPLRQSHPPDRADRSMRNV